MPIVDHTHSPELSSWVPEADGHPDFPIQNLPLGVFSPPGEEPRGGIAIGESILDLRALHKIGLLDGQAQAAWLAAFGAALNPVLALGAEARVELRRAVSGLLAQGAVERPELLYRAA